MFYTRSVLVFYHKMKRKNFFGAAIVLLMIVILFSFTTGTETNAYTSTFANKLVALENKLDALIKTIETADLKSEKDREKIRVRINLGRVAMKGTDFWLRYLEPVAYKQINGPLPVEWETEVFEKFEKPYKRGGAGLTLAANYLDEETLNKDSLLHLVKSALVATKACKQDTVTNELNTYHHFYLCNRLFLLNLAAIYTTGFECPDTSRVLPELLVMLEDVENTSTVFNETFPKQALPVGYLALLKKTIHFVRASQGNYLAFDHFTFVKDYVNPLFSINQGLIQEYNVVSKSYMDYSINKNCNSIFNKSLYNGQDIKGLFRRVSDQKLLAEIEKVGKTLFYDPILSGNNLRSCGSCHKPEQCFTDTTAVASLQYNRKEFLPRNTPSLINAPFNHLAMLDGKHYTLQDQAMAVITNSIEMGGNEKDILQKVLSCKEYKDVFTRALKFTPEEPEITMKHIASALTLYYGKFSRFYSPFDNAMNNKGVVKEEVKLGFNLFMGKAQCATCHFVPQFNGVKPPYVGSEFEVLGTPADTAYKQLSKDLGRYNVNPATETQRAFRTGSIRNAEKHKPYMHNGVFNTLNQVIEFYNTGGGAGHGLKVDNQTLSSDSLHLNQTDKLYLIRFIQSLNEEVIIEEIPKSLPVSKNKTLNTRVPGGIY